MKELLSIIKKYKWKLIFWSIALFIIPISIVHCLFKLKTNVDFFVAEWTAGELLGYIAAVLSFIGTMLLSIMALYSSKKANDLSQKVTDLEQNRYKLELRPFVLVTSWKAYEITANEIQFAPQKKYIQIGDFNDQGALCLSLSLTNTTNSFISVRYSTGKTNNRLWKNVAVNQSNLKLDLLAGKSDEFVFYATKKDLEQLTNSPIELELILENKFSQRYKETFTIIVTSLSYLPSYSKTEWFCQVHAQDYSISKFMKSENGEIILISEDL